MPTDAWAVHKDAAIVRLPSGELLVIDAQDVPAAERYAWHKRAGETHPYARAWVKGPPKTTVYLHRLVMGFPAGLVDHHDGDWTNNRRSNLRLADSLQNSANSHPQPGTSSRYKGVYRDRVRQKWVAGIGLSGRSTYIGAFESEEDAARAYDKRAIEEWGEFAWLNLPTDDSP